MTPLRIALIHNRYRYRGGEDSVVDFEEEVLAAAGHDVFRLEVDNDSVFRPPGPRAVHALWNAPFNRRSQRRVERFLREHGCQVGHVHNWFPLLSPAVYAAHQAVGVPVVQTLHNYRLGCAAGTLMRAGRLCTKCLDGDRAPAVAHRCYRGSGALTRVWRRTVEQGFERGRFVGPVARYLAPSSHVIEVHRRLGLPAEKMVLLPHGVPDPGPAAGAGADADARSGALFVGRLSPEKGIDALLEAWDGLDVPLTIIGSGPEEERVRAAARRNAALTWRPHVPRDEVLAAMADAAFVVSPHRSPETFGLVVAEALAVGRPVLASALGGPLDMITQGENGWLVPPGDVEALRASARRLAGDPRGTAAMGVAARRVYERRYRPEAHVDALVAILEDVIGEADGRARRAA